MPSAKVTDVLGAIGIEVPASEISHYGVKGMKWDKNLTPEEREKKRLEALAKEAEKITNQNNKAEAFAKVGDNLFDKKVTYINQGGAKYIQNALGGKELGFTTLKARSAVKQGKINRLIEDIFNGKKKPKKDPTFSNKSVIKSIGKSLPVTKSKG
jgi:hypothetical protein